jgi:arginine-tRNA-protein transferase
MSEYFSTNSVKLSDFSDENICNYYKQGYVFTRLGKGEMIQTRSLRVDLNKFELTSENRRILRKNDQLQLNIESLPLQNYPWQIHAYAKDFYTKRFGEGTMSASKVKELVQEQEISNFNKLFVYNYNIPFQHDWELEVNNAANIIGMCICYINNSIFHYGYPFYDLSIPKENSLGLAMMTKAIEWAKNNSKTYIYLGSVTDQKSLYKLQYEGLEWWDNSIENWSQDISQLKMMTNNSN